LIRNYTPLTPLKGRIFNNVVLPLPPPKGDKEILLNGFKSKSPRKLLLRAFTFLGENATVFSLKTQHVNSCHRSFHTFVAVLSAGTV